jgi:hypothetical protein
LPAFWDFFVVPPEPRALLSAPLLSAELSPFIFDRGMSCS